MKRILTEIREAAISLLLIALIVLVLAGVFALAHRPAAAPTKPVPADCPCGTECQCPPGVCPHCQKP